MNTFVIAGNLTRDPVITSVNVAGTTVSKCTFTVAVRRAKSSKADAADFIPCTAWRLDAENIKKFFTKGRKILVQGHIVTGSYPDASTGATKYTYDFNVDNWEFCDSAKAGTTSSVNLDDYMHTDEDVATTDTTSTSDFTEVDTGTYVAPPAQEAVSRTSVEDMSLPF